MRPDFIIGGILMKKKLLTLAALSLAGFMLAGCGARESEPSEAGNQTEGNQIEGNQAEGNRYADENGEGTAEEGRRPIEREWLSPQAWQFDAGFTETPMDLGGRLVRIVTAEGYSLFNYWYWDPRGIDATPNETHDIINAMSQIAEDFNAEFEFIHTQSGADIRESMLQSRLAGDPTYDLINMGLTHANKTPFANERLFLDMRHPSVNDIIGLDDGQPWAEAGRLMTQGGAQLGVHFLMANSGQLLRSVMVFNKDHMSTFNLGNFYEMVHNNTWTWDTFENICSRVWIESNQRITPIGIRRESEIAPNFMKANGGTLIDFVGGRAVFVGDINEPALEAFAFLQRMHQNNWIYNGTWSAGDANTSAWMRAAAGDIMFLAGLYEPLRQFRRAEIPTDFHWGMLPTPMGPRMTEYVSAQVAADMWYIANDTHNHHEIAAILVAMANRLSKINVVQHELEVGLFDEESAEIMYMLLNNVVVDYSRAVGGARNEISSGLNNVIQGFQTPVAAMQARAQVIQNHLDTVDFLVR